MREGRMLFDFGIWDWRSDNITTIFTLRFKSISDFLAFGVLDGVVMVLEAGLCNNAWVCLFKEFSKLVVCVMSSYVVTFKSF